MSGSQALQLAIAIDKKNVAVVLLLEPPVERFLRVESPKNALLVDNIYLGEITCVDISLIIIEGFCRKVYLHIFDLTGVVYNVPRCNIVSQTVTL